MKNLNILLMAILMAIEINSNIWAASPGSSPYEKSRRIPKNQGLQEIQNIQIILPTQNNNYVVYHDTCKIGNIRFLTLYCIEWKNEPTAIYPNQNNNYALPSGTAYDKYYVGLADGTEIPGTSHSGNKFVDKTTWAFSLDATTNTIS